MTSELSSPNPMPALPVRRRETLEIFDTALKLYRRHFWVLLGWSALTSALGFVPILNLLAIFTMPLLQGAISCCVAAAVRGQSVKFSQCWGFTKPRYGPLLGTMLLSYLLLGAILVGIYLVIGLIGLAGWWALSNAPQPVQIVGAVLGFVLLLLSFLALGVVAFGWTTMVPIVVCLEDDKRSTAALGRAFDLLKGNWRRVFGLCLILGLAVIAAGIIVSVAFALFGFAALSTVFRNPSADAVTGIFTTFGAFMGLFGLIWNPAQSLVIAVLYLDLRVRREALDLEWTAYASAPAPTLNPTPNLTPAPLDFLTPTPAPTADMPLLATEPAPAPASFAAGNARVADARSEMIAPQIASQASKTPPPIFENPPGEASFSPAGESSPPFAPLTFVEAPHSAPTQPSAASSEPPAVSADQNTVPATQNEAPRD